MCRRRPAWERRPGVRDASSCAPVPELPPSLLVLLALWGAWWGWKEGMRNLEIGCAHEQCIVEHPSCNPAKSLGLLSFTQPHSPPPYSHRQDQHLAMTSLLLHRAWHNARTRIVAAVAPRSSILLPSSCLAPPAASPTTVCVRWKHGAKSHQGAKKRFRLLKNGDVLRGHAGKSHNTGHRSTVQMSRLRVSTTIAPSFAARIRRLVLGV